MKNIKVLLNYNFNLPDIADNDFESLFEKRRNDSCFAFVYQKDNKIYAIRDHIGMVPLYFRFMDGEVKFSTSLTALSDKTCNIDLEGLKYFIAFGTTRLKPLTQEVMIVPPGSVIKIDAVNRKTELIYRYKIKNLAQFTGNSLSDYVDRLDEIFMEAVGKTLKFNTVGLYLSGGIDSALTGIYLKKNGAKINSYTSAPWGKNSSEIPFAKINAEKIGVNSHYIDYLDGDKYPKIINNISRLYGSPHGTTTGMAVASLWDNTKINEEKQIYGAQGCDTITCSVSSQYISFFLEFFPKIVRLKLHDYMGGSLLKNYLSLITNGLVDDHEYLHDYLIPGMSKISMLSLSGLYVAHTPSDGEVISGPAVNNNILFSNPFYDIDLIKFFLSIPLRFRLKLVSQSKTKITIDKIIFRKLAERYLPKELVWRKKGFTVSLNRSDKFSSTLSNLPDKILDIPLKNQEMGFRAMLISGWCDSIGIRLNYNNRA
jgi:asparagine synthetase B (glutamine-hydrolysing)